MTLTIDELQRLVGLSDTKANIIAFAGTPTEVLVAYATDTLEIGIYAGGTWRWVGAGSSVSPASTVTDETAFGIAPDVGTGTDYARDDHTHGSPDADAVRDIGHWEPVVFDPGTGPEVVFDATDIIMVWVT